MLAATVASLGVTMPPVSPTGLQNRIWRWRGFDVRYQCLGDERADGPAVLFVHGLFVNADHWRRNLPALADAGCRCYAIDLLGYGYSSKPNPLSEAAKAVSGENGRSLSAPVADLGTAGGGTREGVEVELAHPVAGSPYNFYTWSEQLLDFEDEVVGGDEPVTLVANSIGSISALQAAIDAPARINGVAIVNPNFRELHVSEQPALLRPLLVPIIEAVQRTLRERGQPLFDALARPATVQQILKEPYFDADMVTDELVDVPPTAPLLPADRGAHPPARAMTSFFCRCCSRRSSSRAAQTSSSTRSPTRPALSPSSSWPTRDSRRPCSCCTASRTRGRLPLACARSSGSPLCSASCRCPASAIVRMTRRPAPSTRSCSTLCALAPRGDG